MAGQQVGVWACVVVVLTARLTTAIVTYQPIEDGFIISFQNEEVFIHTTHNPIFCIGSGRANFTEQHGNFEVEEEVNRKFPLVDFDPAIRKDYVQVTFTTSEDPSLTFELYVREVSPSTALISAVAKGSSAMYNRLWVRLWANETERVWGAGEQYSYLNLRGRHYPVWTSEQGVGRDGGIIANVSDIDGGAGGDYYTTYYPLPTFLSSRRYTLTIEDARYLVMNFTEPSYHEVFLHNDQFRATLLREATLLATVQSLTLGHGAQPQLPDWIIGGTTLGVQRGTDEMLFRYDEARAAGVNVTGLWIQDWSGSIETLFGHRVYWNWRWNQTYYPDLDKVIESLALEGVRVLVYMNPHLIEDSEMFLEAADLGHLMTDSSGEAFRQDFGGFLAGTVDLLSPAARGWYSAEIEKNLLDLGVGGWMADFGEYTRLDMYSSDSDYDAESRHNLLPVKWAQCNKEALENAGKLGDAVPFMRSGGLGAARHQLLAWAGDQNVDWSFGDGLPTTVTAALSLAMSGIGVTHFDIGGYTTQAPVLKRSKELLLRSAEYAVFTPVMRTHEGNKPASNHQYYSDKDTLLQFARLTQMHARLLPYTRSLIQELITLGTPLQRPLFLHFEEDAESWNAEYQYLYGPDLLVAPVLYKGMESWPVYLPGGGSEWVHLWGDGAVLTGPALLEMPAPLGYPLVFYRSDSSWVSLFQEIAEEFGSEGRWARRQ